MSAPLSSPLPWRIDGQCIRDADGLVVVGAINPCGMAARLRIVEAVNSHAALKAEAAAAAALAKSNAGLRARVAELEARP